MKKPNLEHPNEDALERFLLHRSGDDEVEVLETHILACESCITRLETLELQITDLKAALGAAEQERIAKEASPAKEARRKWFTLPTLSWAGAACAALAVCLTVVPSYLHHSTRTAGIENKTAAVSGDLSICRDSNAGDAALATCRGTESAVLPEGRPLDLKLDTTDIPPGPVDVQVVNGSGTEIWQGQTEVTKERAEVKLPQISQTGPYFLRFYAPSASTERELLREFRFEVK